MTECKTKQFSRLSIESGHVQNFLFFICTIGSLLWSLYFANVIIKLPYQIGFREGQPQVLTQMLLNGENPYTFNNQPLAYNVYSISYSIVVLPFAAWFGNTIHVHRLVTFTFICLSTVLGFWSAYWIRRNFVYALTCASFIMIALMGTGGIGSTPSSMGAFLYFVAIVLPFFRSFDRIGLWISIFFALWAFYTKAYFVLSFGIVLLYLFLFVSKKRAFSYFITFFVLFFISAIIVRVLFPLYFVNSIGGNISNTFRTFENLFEQMKDLIRYFFPLIFATVLLLKTASPEKTTSFYKKMKINTSWNTPLFETQPHYFLFVFLIAFFVYIIFLATHVGNYLSYAYEMALPPFFVWFFTRFEFKKWVGFVSILLIIFNLGYWQNITLNPQMLEQRNSSEWKKLFSFIKPSMKILNSPIVTSRLIELGITPVDSGQTGYYYFMKPYLDYSWFGPSYVEFYAHGEAYINYINQSIISQDYDLIITTKDVDVFYDLTLIEKYYSLEKQFIIYMNPTQQKWVAQVWKRK